MATPAPFTPWYVPGWTAQDPYPTQATTIDPAGPNFLPADIPLIVVTGKYVMITGYDVGGLVKFDLLGPSFDSVSSTLLLPASIHATITNGALSVKIPAGSIYRVKEVIPGGRTWDISIPLNQVTPVDINSLPKV